MKNEKRKKNSRRDGRPGQRNRRSFLGGARGEGENGWKKDEKGLKRVKIPPKNESRTDGGNSISKVTSSLGEPKRPRAMTIWAAVFRARRNGRERSHYLDFYDYLQKRMLMDVQ